MWYFKRGSGSIFVSNAGSKKMGLVNTADRTGCTRLRRNHLVIYDVYLDKQNDILFAPTAPKESTVLGQVGDGQDDDPVGLLPANICTICGASRIRTTSGFWACPKGHGRLGANPDWNGEQPGMFEREIIAPIPVRYYNKARLCVPEAGHITFPCVIEKRKKQRPIGFIVDTDVRLPEYATATWLPQQNFINDTHQVLYTPPYNDMRQIRIQFPLTPAEPIPAVGEPFGMIRMAFPLPVRFIWSPKYSKS